MTQTLDWHRSDYRSSSIEAYYTPVQTRRQGWTILIQHQVGDACRPAAALSPKDVPC